MTNDEAIAILQDVANYTVDGYSFVKIREAIRMAIKALNTQRVMDNYFDDIKINRPKGEPQ